MVHSLLIISTKYIGRLDLNFAIQPAAREAVKTAAPAQGPRPLRWGGAPQRRGPRLGPRRQPPRPPQQQALLDARPAAAPAPPRLPLAQPDPNVSDDDDLAAPWIALHQDAGNVDAPMFQLKKSAADGAELTDQATMNLFIEMALLSPSGTRGGLGWPA